MLTARQNLIGVLIVLLVVCPLIRVTYVSSWTDGVNTFISKTYLFQPLELLFSLAIAGNHDHDPGDPARFTVRLSVGSLVQRCPTVGNAGVGM